MLREDAYDEVAAVLQPYEEAILRFTASDRPRIIVGAATRESRR